jgi:serine phosphatase RsbU (regulator of sigma subunit)/pSer/pThr/pTyr-binding forkhead associated (FHA) protein
MPEITVQSADGKKRRIPLVRERMRIGRSRDSDIFLPDQWLSRHHAEIRQHADGHYLFDLGSKNGTLLNGNRIDSERRLSEGDVITLGEHVLTFSPDVSEDEDDDFDPLGTRVFNARELSDVATKPAIDPAELQRQNRVLGILTRATSALLNHRPLPELFELILNLIFEAVPAERGAILLLEGTPPQPVIKASRSREGAPIAKVSRSITRKVIQDRVVLILSNVLENASFRAQDSILSTGIRSAVCVPLLFTPGEGKPDEVIGLVYLDTLRTIHSFEKDDVEVLTALANVAAVKIENVRLLEESLEKRRMEEDMRRAAEIQRGLLPTAPPQVTGYGLVGSNSPCRTVGGDYYDFALHEGRLLLALGDVSGKGTGAALLMTVLRAAVRGHWADGSVSEAMGRINKTVCQNVTEGKYVTFVMARLDPESGRLTYVNAGHNAPLLVRAGGAVEPLEEGGMVLGMFESVPYAEGIVELRSGDALVIFSDGVTETFNPAGDEFGSEMLVQVVLGGRALPASALENEILAELERFAAGAKATDDRTIIVLKRE